jgi:hypothetical protein
MQKNGNSFNERPASMNRFLLRCCRRASEIHSPLFVSVRAMVMPQRILLCVFYIIVFINVYRLIKRVDDPWNETSVMQNARPEAILTE